MSESTTPPPLSTVKESWSQEEMAARDAMNGLPMNDDNREPPIPQNMSRHQSRQPSPSKSPTKSQLQVKPQQKEEEEEDDKDNINNDDAEDARLKQSRPPVDRRQARTPEPKQRRSQRVSAVQPSPSTPGRIAPFDWDDFEARYQKALADADEKEKAILEEFDQLVKYFNVWASASSSHDNERAIKRLQTRTRFVHLSEQRLNQKKQHLSEVVKAFQSALALLSAA